ncbi:5-methyltetrahydropteroyltriglutamate--homocysteine S-methyltransferase [Ideonella sp. BN130291]|uniref:5-methyltetrahydropteroyltriglutamate-- homocysteine S-methyltransferase n=1 Tax=Ideonella sp. BN130291 TaxID=3112940 RepID=UPI002E25BDA2|nr:5-methyltetrahydropteroyltriglutamate--homocysteine S-methyltransferase [Ideonella sp. BN130291]
MARSHILGFPRIGAQRELKSALEAFWRGDTSEAELQATGAQLRERHWALQREAGLSQVTAGDFCFYDHVLAHTLLLGALPARFGFDARHLTLAQGFELARGNAAQPAMEMTKWFDTNYHYLVPELGPQTRFDGGHDAWFEHIDQALQHGGEVKPVLPGPITYLRIAKSHTAGFDRLSLLPALCDAYRRILARLAARGVQWVQLDEPALCTDLDERWLAATDTAYAALAGSGVRLLLATYFDAVDAVQRVARLPVQGFHVDLVRAPQQLGAWRAALPGDAVLSAGVVDGRNVWRTDLRPVLGTLQLLHEALGDRLWVAPSCSLLHVPVSLAGEAHLDPALKPWLAFATEKLQEVVVLTRALNEGEAAVAQALQASDSARASRTQSRRVTNELVRKRVAALTPAMAERRSAFTARIQAQQAALKLPLLPTTTIGSFPQTSDIRRARAACKRGELSALDYLQRMREEIRIAIRQQEALGLDMLVHGEAERNDMVEYFGEQLWGVAFTENGWVQSYGSRCVKPPIIFGDVYRPEPMTVETATYAQSLTERPVKGMLTGPVTLLQWSFVRDDQPREATLRQLALVIRDEVLDLEKAGIRAIQIDEPAFREGLPLKARDQPRYLEQAVGAFKLAAGGVRDDTQIHTHMCYSEFSDILPAIAAMDADVITIETSRSNMELLDAFGSFRYPNDIGPGVYDIHSPRVPSAQAMQSLLQRACKVIAPERLWVNPDCGLKTRGWPETEAALKNMVEAAREVRAALAAQAA